MCTILIVRVYFIYGFVFRSNPLAPAQVIFYGFNDEIIRLPVHYLLVGTGAPTARVHIKQNQNQMTEIRDRHGKRRDGASAQ